MNITQPGSVTTSSQAATVASRTSTPNPPKDLPVALQNATRASLAASQELSTRQETEKKLDENEAKTLTEAANSELANLTTALAFSVDRDINRFIVRLVDTSSQETLRQYPAEEMIEVFKALKRVNELMTPEQAQGTRGLGSDLSSGVLFRGKA
ncbi:flagellar protein FlaG [Dechloromonas sp. ZY10]|uniref:flagellar protein FlaG n=1 Tax=Dechloromonas aquae TaxID=2664436 RepID=UPI003526F112